jgi:hypothetical protein
MATSSRKRDKEVGTIVPTSQSAALRLLTVWTAVITGSEAVASVREKDAMFGRWTTLESISCIRVQGSCRVVCEGRWQLCSSQFPSCKAALHAVLLVAVSGSTQGWA